LFSLRRIAIIFGLATFLLVVVAETSDHRAYAGSAAPPSSSVPVLVELFTSEGCSSCPPADALLKTLEHTQPVAGATVVALSEHVDYWNHDGWTDRFSSSQYTDRQRKYVRLLKLPGSYTPQMVVDGKVEFTGSDAPRAEREIARARADAKVAMTISGMQPSNGKEINFRLATEASPSGRAPQSMDVIVMVATPEAETQVQAGENGGRTLHHIDVARSIERVASIHRGEAFAHDLTIKLPPGIGNDFLLVAFLQESSTGTVWGVASERTAH
jgi:hypothetical protein